MKLVKLELQNYKSHKSFIADFDGDSLIEGNKGSGKTSLKDAYTWLITGAMVDDPTPVDENGVIIDHLTIAVEGTFDNDLVLRIESKQNWVKDVLKGNHVSTYFVNGTPCTQTAYQETLNEEIGTLEQRKIVIDPAYFAFGDGLKVTGKTPKTAIQRRREIVIGVAGAADMEAEIAKYDEKAKQAKYALSQLKKQLSDAESGINRLESAKIDTSGIDKKLYEQTLENLKVEETNAIKALESLDNDDETKQALRRTLSEASTALSEAEAKYALEHSKRTAELQKPLDEYRVLVRSMQSDLQDFKHKKQLQDNEVSNLFSDVERLSKQYELKLAEHKVRSLEAFIPDSTTCITCLQPLPVERLKESELRFNQQKATDLERIVEEGKKIAADLAQKRKELEVTRPHYDADISRLEEELTKVKEPVIEVLPTFRETKEFADLSAAKTIAVNALNNNDNSDTKAIYERSIENTRIKMKEVQNSLEVFKTNDHLEKEIEKVAVELQGIAEQQDKQEAILLECDAFIKKTLNALESTLEEKFKGIRFKMFDTTLDGSQVNTCITYAKTDKGYTPWNQLSGGETRSAIIKLANAFNEAWGIDLPLWIDDTQIYVEDSIEAKMQLIRITEVPNAKLEVR